MLKKRFNYQYQEKVKVQEDTGKKQTRLKTMQHFVQISFQGIVILLLSFKTISKKIAISDFVVLFNSILEIENQLDAMIQLIPRIFENELYLEKIDEFLYEKEAMIYGKGKADIDKIVLKKPTSTFIYAYSQDKSQLLQFKYQAMGFTNSSSCHSERETIALYCSKVKSDSLSSEYSYSHGSS